MWLDNNEMLKIIAHTAQKLFFSHNCDQLFKNSSLDKAANLVMNRLQTKSVRCKINQNCGLQIPGMISGWESGRVFLGQNYVACDVRMVWNFQTGGYSLDIKTKQKNMVHIDYIVIFFLTKSFTHFGNDFFKII